MELPQNYLVIGSGIAGLRAAIELSSKGKNVTLMTKSNLEDSNTIYAQGGIAAVDPSRIELGEDSYESHTRDTKKAGGGLCDSDITKRFSENAYKEIDFLIKSGVEFTKTKEGYPYELHQEGGHEHERIYCVGDYTGKAIEETLVDIVRKDPNITILENHTAINLITSNSISGIKSQRDTCVGAYVLNRKTEKVIAIEADKTFLATGGAGRVFQYTSNPENATGDGIAMAYKAGAKITNMEFMQFHPSVLYEESPKDPSEKRYLITEALRGEKVGGILTLKKDSLDDFVKKYDSRGSHATRDIVSRAIDTEMKINGLKHVWLNVTEEATGKSEEYIKTHFPKIYEKCKEKGIDITKEPVPVIPAAHYTCGGVVVDKNGQTDIESLYAIGEVAYTGLMGANRLASNSLSEAALYGRLAVEHALNTKAEKKEYDIPEWDTGSAKEKADVATMNQFWDTTRTTMMNLCAIERNEQRLKLALATINALVDASEEMYKNFYPTHEIIELRNLTLSAKLIAESALQRKESRGCHYRSDFPHKNESYAKPTIMVKEA